MLFFTLALQGQKSARHQAQRECLVASFDGEVEAGQAYRRVFASGQEFFLEPLASGWILRVLEVKQGRELREKHDWAEVATPPYQSVSPLLISTDWAFRAQDAVAWNPREFHFSADRREFEALSSFEERILKGDQSVVYELSKRVMQQPEGTLRITSADLVPGLRDQGAMAAAVASHWESTPHVVVQGQAPSALGKIVRLRFSVELVLPQGVVPMSGIATRRYSCESRPTN